MFWSDLPLPTPHTFLKRCIQASNDLAKIFDMERVNITFICLVTDHLSLRVVLIWFRL